MTALPNTQHVAIDSATADTQRAPLFQQTVALLHFGRSGTGLLHSLIDSHPEVSTLPGIYLSGYFTCGVWERLIDGPAESLPERFADMFAVLFDATSAQQVPAQGGEDTSNLGIKEGMTNVGENRDAALRVDRAVFCAEARRLMAVTGDIDAAGFLQIIHAAYEHALHTTANKHTIFYHIHNPNKYAKLNFLRQVPEARLIMMIREPLRSCESWTLEAVSENDCLKISQRILAMLYDIDQVSLRRQDSVGVRLEDLKSRPEATMRALCKWMGIQETPSLYEMTAQGKKWWGDPSSPNYNKKEQMSPFGDAGVQRPLGSVFGERDQLLLKTLFYPFSVRFGYCEPDPEGFKRNLKEARIILDGLFDFEKTILQRTDADPRQYQRNGDYLILRAAMGDRLDVLDELGTYPHMLSPLVINEGE